MPRARLVLALAAAAPAVSAAPASAAYKGCRMSAGEAQHMGASYIVDGRYKVQRVSCATGKKVIRAFHACRAAHGGWKRGKCPRSASVLGFRCREKRTVQGGVLTGSVTCARGDRRVAHFYSNFLT